MPQIRNCNIAGTVNRSNKTAPVELLPRTDAAAVEHYSSLCSDDSMTADLIPRICCHSCHSRHSCHCNTESVTDRTPPICGSEWPVIDFAKRGGIGALKARLVAITVLLNASGS